MQDSNQLKLYTTLFVCSWRVRKSLLCFRSLNGMRLHAVVYNVVDVDKIFTVSYTKQPSLIRASRYMAKTIFWLIC